MTALDASNLDSITWGDPLMAEMYGTRASAPLSTPPGQLLAWMSAPPETVFPAAYAQGTVPSAAVSAPQAPWYQSPGLFLLGILLVAMAIWKLA